MPSVAQDDVSDVADTVAVNEDTSGRHGTVELCTVFVKLQHASDFRNENVIGRHAHRFGKHLVCAEVTVFAVDRHEILRAEQRMHHLDLFLAGVTGNVHVRNAGMDDGDVLFGQLIDDAADELFVAGNRGCGNHDEILGAELDLIVLGIRHTGQRAHRFSLRAGRNDGQLLGVVFFDFVQIDDRICGNAHITELNCRGNDVQHGAAGDGDLAVVFCAGVDDLLDAVNIGGEGRNDDALILIAEIDILQRRADVLFRRCITGALCVGRFAQQQQYTFVAELTESGQIDHRAVNRG